ncbi:unnamed protein product [Lampetra fluviatilis]
MVGSALDLQIQNSPRRRSSPRGAVEGCVTVTEAALGTSAPAARMGKIFGEEARAADRDVTDAETSSASLRFGMPA